MIGLKTNSIPADGMYGIAKRCLDIVEECCPHPRNSVFQHQRQFCENSVQITCRKMKKIMADMSVTTFALKMQHILFKDTPCILSQN